jgi:hypothetical protein
MWQWITEIADFRYSVEGTGDMVEALLQVVRLCVQFLIG